MGLKENTFSILFESIQEGLIVVNANGEIVLCNAVVEKLFGYQPSELIGQKIEVLVPLNNRKNILLFENLIIKLLVKGQWVQQCV